MNPWVIRAVVVVFLGSGLAGCQTGFTITVEKLAEVSSRREVDTDHVLRAVHDILMDLDDLCLECQITCGDQGVESPLAPILAAQRPVRLLVALAEDLMARRARGELGGCLFAAQVDALRRRAIDVVPTLSAEAFETFIASKRNDDELATMAAMARRVPAELRDYSIRLESIPRQVGFGGFRQAGVYQINPGDAAYEAVLAAGTAASPLTRVRILATGDTGAMIVQESPGQMRLYQISNDPLTVMHNVSLILDKVLQAAVKFGSTGSL